MGHLVRLDFGLDHLLAGGQIDGWFPRFMLGHQMFLINGPGFTWIVGLVQLLTGGTLSLEGALKVVAIGSYVGLVPAVAYLARGFLLPPLASLLAGVMSLAVSSHLGVGIEGIFGTGLIPQQVGAILLCLTVGSTLRLLERPSFGLGVSTAVFSTLLLLTHLRSALIAVLILVLYALVRPRSVLSRPSLLATATAGALAVGLSAFWLIPFLAHRELRGGITSFGPSTITSRLAEIWAGGFVYPPTISRIVLLAWFPAFIFFTFFWRRGLVLLWVPAAIFVSGYAIQHFLGVGEISVQFVERAVGYIGILALLPLAALLGWIVPRQRNVQILALVAVAVYIATALRTDAEQVDSFSRAIPEMKEAAQVLQRVVPPTSRFVLRSEFPDEIARTGVIHPETWLVFHSERNALNVFGPELSPSWRWEVADRFAEGELSESADEFREYGVTHAVVTSEESTKALQILDDFELVWQDPPLAVFEITTRPGEPDPRDLLTARNPADLSVDLTGEDSQLMRFDVRASSAVGVIAPLSWSPKWVVEVGGKSVVTKPTDEMLLAFQLPPGDHVVSIEFRSDRWDALGLSITAASLGGTLLLPLRDRSRRTPRKQRSSLKGSD